MMFTVDDVLTSSGRFPKRKKLATQEVIENAKVLVDRLNPLMVAFGASRKFSSGFRDPSSNKAAGGAKRSAHMEGKAVDVEDKNRSFAIFCLRNEALLAKLKLWMEDPMRTPTWVHLQSRPASKTVFLP